MNDVYVSIFQKALVWVAKNLCLLPMTGHFSNVVLHSTTYTASQPVSEDGDVMNNLMQKCLHKLCSGVQMRSMTSLFLYIYNLCENLSQNQMHLFF